MNLGEEAGRHPRGEKAGRHPRGENSSSGTREKKGGGTTVGIRIERRRKRKEGGATIEVLAVPIK